MLDFIDFCHFCHLIDFLHSQNLQQRKEAFPMANPMFILKVHSWRFLGIFEAEKNLSDAYKEVYVVLVGRLPISKKFSLRK